MAALTILLSAFLGALGRRVAGGAFQQWTGLDIGDYPVRLFFGVTLALASLIGGANWWVIAVVPLAVFFGCSVPNFDGIDLGRDGTRSWATAAVGLEMHGVLSMVLPTIVGVWWFSDSWLLVLLGGTMIVPMYEMGWRLAPTPRTSLPPGFRGGSEIGECLWGAVMGVAFWSTGS